MLCCFQWPINSSQIGILAAKV